MVLESNNLNYLLDSEIEVLISEEYLVEKDNEELNLFFQHDILNITIAISNKCNFICSYCFERDTLDNQQKVMTKEDKDRFVVDLMEYIDYQIKYVKEIHMTWFGGEPLLSYDFIVKINQMIIDKCSEKGIKYGATYITNGYFLTEKRIKKIIEQNVEMIQITIDGSKEIHNSRRTTRNYEDTYSVLLDNINNVIKNEFSVLVRINLDKENVGSVELLLEDLAKKRNGQYCVEVSIGRTTGSTYSFTEEEFIEKNMN